MSIDCWSVMPSSAGHRATTSSVHGRSGRSKPAAPCPSRPSRSFASCPTAPGADPGRPTPRRERTSGRGPQPTRCVLPLLFSERLQMCVLRPPGRPGRRWPPPASRSLVLETLVAPRAYYGVSGLLFTAGDTFRSHHAVSPPRNFLKLLQMPSGNRFACDSTVAATPAASEPGVNGRGKLLQHG